MTGDGKEDEANNCLSLARPLETGQCLYLYARVFVVEQLFWWRCRPADIPRLHSRTHKMKKGWEAASSRPLHISKWCIRETTRTRRGGLPPLPRTPMMPMPMCGLLLKVEVQKSPISSLLYIIVGKALFLSKEHRRKETMNARVFGFGQGESGYEKTATHWTKLKHGEFG